MIVEHHDARAYADAIQALLPPGQAWEWPRDGFGDRLMLAAAQEYTRLDGQRQPVLDRAIDVHRPASSDFTLAAYRAAAAAALAEISEPQPRRAFAVGAHVGDRCWSAAAPSTTFPVPLVQVDHLVGPLRVGSHVGDRCWGHRSRYILRVRYYRSVVRPELLYAALAAFRQAHVFLWLEDITGIGGIYGSH